MIPNLMQSHCTGSRVDSTNCCHSLGVIPSRDKLNIGSITYGTPDNVFRIFALEPTVICLVPTEVCVDHVTHGADIAPAGFVSGTDHQPCIIEPTGRVAGKAAKMGGLHRAERHIT